MSDTHVSKGLSNELTQQEGLLAGAVLISVNSKAAREGLGSKVV